MNRFSLNRSTCEHQDIEQRGIDEWNPIWNVLDLTPQGRGDWEASLDYGTKVQAARG